MNVEHNTIIVPARYGLSHKFEEVATGTWRTTEMSRFSFSTKDENGIYHGVSYIDFDGGPFLHEGEPCPWDRSKVITGFTLKQDGDRIVYVDIHAE